MNQLINTLRAQAQDDECSRHCNTYLIVCDLGRYGCAVDVLSDVLTTMRTGRPHAARTRTWAPWGVRFPATDAAGCHVVLRGSCWLIAEGRDPIPLTSGDVVFLPHPGVYVLADSPGTPAIDFDPVAEDGTAVGEIEILGAGAVTETLCAAYYFDRSRVHPLMEDLPPVVHLPAMPGHRPALRSAVDLLGNELAAARPGSELIVPALIDTLLLFILREWLESNPTTGWATSLNDPVVLRALRAIHLRPDQHWSVDDLARESGLSRAAFAARFRTSTTMPPLTYLTWWRMTLAARMLRTTDATVRAISERVGYTSEFAFTKAFKREFGAAPRYYRGGGPARLPAEAGTVD